MGATQSHEEEDDTAVPREFDRDIQEMKDIGEPASVASTGPAKRSRRHTRSASASAKSAAKSKGSYAAVRKTRRR
jgi:hypothetical protein